MTRPGNARHAAARGGADAGPGRWARGRAIPLLLLVLPFLAATAEPSAGREAKTSAGRAGALELPRHVIATGGGASAGGAWMIRGTIGQSDADPLQPSTGGAYGVIGGFWPALPAPQTDGLFLDGFEAQAD